VRVGRVISGLAIAAVLAGACGSNVAQSPTPSAPAEVAAAAPYRFPPPLAPSAPPPARQPTPPTTEWRTYTSELFQYEIRYPPTWAVTAGRGPFADEIDTGDLPWLFVRRGLADDTTPTVAAAIEHDVLIERRDDRAEFVSAHSISLPGGYEGTYLLYRGRIRLGPVTVQRIIVEKGGVFYYFSLYGERASEAADIALFEQIYGTWKAT